jgi:hypothetical protein
MNHHYQIRVRGHLSDEWSDWFTGLRIKRLEPTDTLLVGQLDQAALHGVLARIRDLNLVLIAVNQSDEDTTTNEGYQLEQGGICVPDG